MICGSELNKYGYTLYPDLYSEKDIVTILKCIDQCKHYGNSSSNTKDVFAIRQLLKTIPELAELLFTKQLIKLLHTLSKSRVFLSKAIYFDKPATSNWFVPFHQDLSISVTNTADVHDYTNWTFKKGQIGVQPPLYILQDTITIRIHLDDTDEANGALKVIPKSHQNGIIRSDAPNWSIDNPIICAVKKGSAMLMKPLLLHASNKTTNGKRRRVIHLEFNTHNLPKGIDWLEYHELNVS